MLPRPSEPVGYRISLARRAIAGAVERLLFDPDPRVVRALLGNPRVTEAEVVKLAASRRAGPQALEIVAQDDRWIARYPVKLALANNPATPVRIVLGLLPYLMRQDPCGSNASIGARRALRGQRRIRAMSEATRHLPGVVQVDSAVVLLVEVGFVPGPGARGEIARWSRNPWKCT